MIKLKMNQAADEGFVEIPEVRYGKIYISYDKSDGSVHAVAFRAGDKIAYIGNDGHLGYDVGNFESDYLHFKEAPEGFTFTVTYSRESEGYACTAQS